MYQGHACGLSIATSLASCNTQGALCHILVCGAACFQFLGGASSWGSMTGNGGWPHYNLLSCKACLAGSAWEF